MRSFITNHCVFMLKVIVQSHRGNSKIAKDPMTVALKGLNISTIPIKYLEFIYVN